MDDHPPSIAALEAILRPLGERLLCSSSGAEAVALAEREDLAVVLLDLQMPELDGFETAALLRKSERSRHVPILLLTSRAPTRDEVERGYATGALEFVDKPPDPAVLRSKVAALVERYERRALAGPLSEQRRHENDPGGRVSERLLAAAPPEDAAETVDALVHLYTSLSEDLALDKIAQRLADEVTDLTGARGGAFHPATRGDAATLAGELGEALAELGPEAPILAPVFRGRGPLRLSDRSPLPGAPAAVRSLLAVPVVSSTGKIDGALVLVHDEPAAFDARKEELAIVAAHHAAAARDNARLYEEASAARRRAELAELELRAGEARLRLALESGGLGTWDYNPKNGALRLDARCKALFGQVREGDVELDAFLSSVHDSDRARVAAAVARALDPSSDGTLDVEYRAASVHAGAPRWLASKGQAIVEQGRAVRLIGVALDYTVKKRIEEERAVLLSTAERARAEAESASRAKDEFLATVSHELRNPLSAILGWSRVLVEGGDDVDPALLKKGLDVIARNAKAQVQLVGDILEVSRIVTGKLRLSMGGVDVRAVVEAALETVRSGAHAKGVVLESFFEVEDGDAGAAPFAIVADEDRVRQVLWNLLSNGVKFTPRGGSVVIRTRRAADEVVFSVEDTGEGIDPSFLPYVFDRFRQADGSTTRAYGGLGLGLSIVRHLVELHGGRVSAESSGRGAGARFTATFPVRPSLAASADGGPPSSSRTADRISLVASPSLGGRRVLVLDDEEDMRDLVAMILEHAGAVVVRASSVDAAMNVLETEAIPDVVVSDLAMPGEDGYALVARARACSRAAVRTVPLVAMTAYARAEDRHRVLGAGFDRHVAKPIEPAELVAVIGELLDARTP